MNANLIISLRILTLVHSGMELKAAFDAILGQGSYEKLASDLHDKINAK